LSGKSAHQAFENRAKAAAVEFEKERLTMNRFPVIFKVAGFQAWTTTPTLAAVQPLVKLLPVQSRKPPAVAKSRRSIPVALPL
jgi:hypothetical protein